MQSQGIKAVMRCEPSTAYRSAGAVMRQATHSAMIRIPRLQRARIAMASQRFAVSDTPVHRA